jgi:tetratricopeptide (TPR) repeat protein
VGKYPWAGPGAGQAEFPIEVAGQRSRPQEQNQLLLFLISAWPDQQHAPRRFAQYAKASYSAISPGLKHRDRHILISVKPSAPDSILQEAVMMHRAGAVREAAARYATVLSRNPRNVDALFFSGMASAQQGLFADAEKALRKAIKIAPKHAAAHNLLGATLRELGKHDEALAAFDRAVLLQPDHVEAFLNRAMQLVSLGRQSDAIETYELRLSQQPNWLEGWNSHGNILAASGRHTDALASFDRAIDLAPNAPELHANRGASLAALERHEEAIASFDRAIAARANFAEAIVNRGNSLRKLNRDDEALAEYDRAIGIRPDFAEAYLSRAFVQQETRNPEAALVDFDRALSLRPALSEAHRPRAIALLALGHLQEALNSCDKAVAAAPEAHSVWLLRCRILFGLGRDEEALAACSRAIELAPGELSYYEQKAYVLAMLDRVDEAFGLYNRLCEQQPQNAEIFAKRASFCNFLGRFEDARSDTQRSLALAPGDDDVLYRASFIERVQGRWVEGSQKYEHRSSLKGLSDLSHRRWTGEPPDGHLLLLVGEQGLGDRIQYCCYVPYLAQLGHRVVLWTDEKSELLLRGVPGVEQTFTNVSALINDKDSRFCWVPIASLPYVLRTTPDSVPKTAPFLAVDATRIAAWGDRIGRSGFKIGIAWQGNPEFISDRFRSIPLREFAPLADVTGVRLLSLQKRPGADQIGGVAFNDRIGTPLADSDLSREAMLDTAAIMMNLDLIVTSDTMIAHLAGALGRPTFLALQLVPDWRWLLDREDTPWYPSVRLFRQKRLGEWGDVFARIGEAVRDAALNQQA